MKIVFSEIEEWERKTFQPLEKEHEVIYVAEPFCERDLSKYSSADIISVFIYSDLNAKSLAQFKQLKLIATRSTGYDHIAIKQCKKQNIVVSNVPLYGEVTVAEHVFGLLLAISHRIMESVDRTRKGDFSSRGLKGFDLQGKTFGLLGTGHIGMHVIRIAKGFLTAC